MLDSVANKNVYANIKKRRNEIGMSQSELAKIVGYSDKTMISKIERGIIDLPLPKLNAIAKALGISASVLLGWDDVEDIKENREFVSGDANVDFAILTKFNKLNQNDQMLVMNMIDSLLEKYK